MLPRTLSKKRDLNFGALSDALLKLNNGEIGERRRTSRNSDWFTPTLNNSSRNTFGRLDFEKQTNFRLVRPDFDFLILQSLNFTFQLENVLKLRKMLLKTTLIFRFNISK